MLHLLNLVATVWRGRQTEPDERLGLRRWRIVRRLIKRDVFGDDLDAVVARICATAYHEDLILITQCTVTIERLREQDDLHRTGKVFHLGDGHRSICARRHLADTGHDRQNLYVLPGDFWIELADCL